MVSRSRSFWNGQREMITLAEDLNCNSSVFAAEGRTDVSAAMFRELFLSCYHDSSLA